MKLKGNFVLRQVADSWVAVSLDTDSLDFNGMLTFNESGALLWRALQQGADRDALADVLTAEYDVDRATALEDAEAFLNTLASAGCIE